MDAVTAVILHFKIQNPKFKTYNLKLPLNIYHLSVYHLSSNLKSSYSFSAFSFALKSKIRRSQTKETKIQDWKEKLKIKLVH